MTVVRCATCQADAPVTEYARVFPMVPLVAGRKVIAYVAVLRHRPCGIMTSVPVRLTQKAVQGV